MTIRKSRLRRFMPLMGVTLLLGTSNAWAVWPVSVDAIIDPVFVSQMVDITAAATSSAKDIAALSLYLEGAGTGNGLIELTAANGDQLAKLNAFNSQYFANLQQSQAITQAQSIQAQRAIERSSSLSGLSSGGTNAACEDVTMASHASAAHQTSRAAGDVLKADVENRMTDNRNETAVLADLIKNRSLFCSAKDVSEKRPGCGAAGALPNADIDAGSLSIGAVNKDIKPSPGTNYTFNANQLQAAQAYVNNLLPLQAPQPQGVAANTPEGKKALVSFLRYNARWGAASEAMNDIIAMHVAMPTTPDGWSSNAAAYARIYGSAAPFPAAPSESELLHFDVMKAYADPQQKSDWSTATGDDLVREQLRMAALQARLQLLTIERQEQQNKMLAVLLSQGLDPTTASSLRAQLPAGSTPAGK